MRIGIANDVPMVAESLRRIVSGRAGTRVVWVAKDGAEAVGMCAKETPDLILMDMIMPNVDGVEATRRIMAGTPCAILVTTSSVGLNAQRVFEAMGHGALDAIDTPALASEGARALLASIDRIARVISARSGKFVTIPAALPVRPASCSGGLVAIGSSAGGPAALAKVLGGLPRDFPAAIVIVQHVDDRFAVSMADWLNRMSSLPVRVASEGDQPTPGGVLLAGTRDHLALKSGSRLGYTPDPADYVYRPSVDVFFQSVSRFWRGDGVGVLLTGMGRDGAGGLKELRENGWHTIAQDQASSAVYGMPKAAAELGAAVEILPLGRIAGTLARLFPGRQRCGGEVMNAATVNAPFAELQQPGDYAIRVLLVDDQLMIGEAVRRALMKEANIEFRYCGNPNDALRAAEEFKPTVILQDLVMPGVDGLTLVRRYRETPATHSIPIVVLSTKEDPTVKSEAFALGASDYLIKLPDAIELIARVRHHSRAYINEMQRDEAYRALHESQRKLIAINEELQRLTNVDGLTGLSNRRYFNEFSGPQWRLAIREQTPISILMIDVDYFKKYNDTYGHVAGDEALKGVGAAMQRSVSRPTDLAARFGGEEFIVLLPATPLESLRKVGERVRAGVEALKIPHMASTACSHVTVSVGGAVTIPGPDDILLALVEAADQALYEAKEAGKNCVVTREK